jgi:hypothetical protein
MPVEAFVKNLDFKQKFGYTYPQVEIVYFVIPEKRHGNNSKIRIRYIF